MRAGPLTAIVSSGGGGGGGCSPTEDPGSTIRSPVRAPHANMTTDPAGLGRPAEHGQMDLLPRSGLTVRSGSDGRTGRRRSGGQRQRAI